MELERADRLTPDMMPGTGEFVVAAHGATDLL